MTKVAEKQSALVTGA